MTQSNSPGAGNAMEERLPRRDWILLPMLGLLTIALIAGSTEWIARRLFSEDGGVDNCLILNDPSTGVRGVPNSVCRQKFPEGSQMEYRFNRCGHDTGMECGPKPRDAYRIVMVGTSIAMGMGMQRDKTFAALLPMELSRRAGRRVELYNESMPLKSPHNITLSFHELLEAEPDMILWILTDWDIKNASLVLPSDEISGSESLEVSGTAAVRSPKPAFPAGAWFRAKAEFASNSITDSARILWRDARSNVMLHHLRFQLQSQSQYLKSSRFWRRDLGYLSAEPTQTGLRHLRDFNSYATEISARAKAAGVPLVAVLLPSGTNAALISAGEWPPDVDPYKLDDELRTIIVSHGETYLDILPDFRSIPTPERGYFLVDGHPNALGHATISSLLARELTSGAVPALKAIPRPQGALQQGW